MPLRQQPQHFAFAPQVHNLLSWWDSLSLIQRKSRSVKSRAAQVVETSVLMVTAARTGLSITQTHEEQQEENEAGGALEGERAQSPVKRTKAA